MMVDKVAAVAPHDPVLDPSGLDQRLDPRRLPLSDGSASTEDARAAGNNNGVDDGDLDSSADLNDTVNKTLHHQRRRSSHHHKKGRRTSKGIVDNSWRDNSIEQLIFDESGISRDSCSQQSDSQLTTGSDGVDANRRPANSIDSDDVNEWKNIPILFKAWDLDGSGTIDRAELLVGLGKYCASRDKLFSPQETMGIFEQADINHDAGLDPREFSLFIHRFTEARRISKEDFCLFMFEYLEQEKRSVEAWEMLPELFDKWDFDGSGFITQKELVLGLDDYAKVRNLELDKHRISDIFFECDENQDYQLDFHEFSIFLSLLAEHFGQELLDLTKVMMQCLNELAKMQEGWALLPRLYEMFDTNGDGEISLFEVSQGINRFTQHHGVNIEENEMKNMFAAADKNRNETLDAREFAVFMAKFADAVGFELSDAIAWMIEDLYATKSKEEGWALLPRLFEIMDYDGSGSIDQKEITKGILRYCRRKKVYISEERLTALFNEADNNNDETLDHREFGSFMNNFADEINVTLDSLAIYMITHTPLSLRLFDTIKKFWKAIMAGKAP